jgi:prepilin-type processing-associated H-X9-DG protein
MYLVARLPLRLYVSIGHGRLIEIVTPTVTFAPLVLCLVCFVASDISSRPWAKHARKAAGYLPLGIVPLLFLVHALTGHSRTPMGRAGTDYCEHYLKQMGIVFRMYAQDTGGEVLPRLSPVPGRLMMLPDAVYPEIISDTNMFTCPGDDFVGAGWEPPPPDPKWIDDQSYFYLGYLVTNDEEMRAFADAYRQRVSGGLPFDEDLPAPAGQGSEGGDSLLMLRIRMRDRSRDDLLDPEERKKVEAADLREAKTVVMIERLGNHETPGGRVLFLDGHVEFMAYPGEWPMTQTTMAILNELDALGPESPAEEE